MPGLSLTVLVDNATLIDRYFPGEPGFSVYIKSGGKHILFDLGYSDIFLTNAGKIGIDLLNIDYVALSHGHIDHTGGLVPFMRHHMEAVIEERQHKKPAIIAHPHCFCPRPCPPLADIGAPVDKGQLARQFPVKTSRVPLWLTDDLVFLGEIPDYGGCRDTRKRTIMLPEGEQPDLLKDDTALAFRSDTGLVIITGCSHSGIGNITTYAQEVCGEEKIRDMIGGFHLMGDNADGILETVLELAEIKPANLHPCHCTSLASKIALAKVAPVHEVGVGLNLEY
ncbi:MAG: MBL fold metallo-hydrolase [Methanoregula sp.]|nr:MBL fold metallo-hydrolase [Methanoregula sp.]